MNRYYFFFKKGSKINQIICAILICMPVFAYGMTVGWMSPMSLLLQSENSPRGEPLSDAEVSWMASVGYLVCFPADLLMAFLADRFGRKTTLMFMSSVTVAGWILKLSSLETWAFVTARSLFGITMAGSFVTCSIYTKEISEISVKGVLGSLIILAQTTGNLFLYVIGDLLPYRAVLWVCLAVPAVHLALFMMMPESPSYLVKRGNYEEAARVLAWLRCRDEHDQEITEELNELRREQKADDESSKFVIKNILTEPVLFRAFRIAIFISLAREVCGAIPVTNFAGEIFAKASTSLVLSPNQQAMMLGAVQVAGSAVASSVVEKAGRKIATLNWSGLPQPLLIITSLVSGLSMCTLASWFLVRYYSISAPDWIPVATLCLCIFCDSSGLQPVSVVLIGEIFSYKYRGTVMAIAMALASIAAFLQVLFFKLLVSVVGSYTAFYFFGAICLIAVVYIIIAVPETKMRTVDEIQNSLKTKKEKQKELEKAKELEAQA